MPAPHPLGGEVLSINDSVRENVARDIVAHPDHYQAFISPSLTGVEATAFVTAHPEAVTVEKRLGRSTVFVLFVPVKP